MNIALTITLVVLVLFGLVFSLFAGRAVRQNSIPRDNGQIILDPKGLDDGLALVIYQPSNSGKIDDWARLIAGVLYKAGYKVVLDQPSLDLSTQISEYDLIVLGSSVQVGQMSAAILDYAYNLPGLRNKTLGLFSNSQSKNTSEFDEIAGIVKGKPRLVTAKFDENDLLVSKRVLRQFVKDLLKN